MRTSNFKTQLLSFASASAIAFAATPAIAQEADDAEEQDANAFEEIVVTGLRASIMSSVARKRESSSIVESISAEDLGKLPDASIAEAIARLPGLAAQRLDGRANVISIRGLAPDFTTTTLNGREQVSANNGRAVEYDQYPSELINGVTIYKTPDASLTTQAVGGTVDMQTIRPLAYGEQAMVFNLRGEYNDLGSLNSGTSSTGYRASFSYVDQFNDDQLGVAIGYARMVSPTQEERWQAWGYEPVAWGGSAVADGDGPLEGLNADDLILGGAKPYVKSNELTRDGLLGVLEYAPHDSSFRTTVDAYYSKFNDEQTLRGIEVPLRWAQNGDQRIQPGWSSTNGVVTDATFNNAEVVVRNDFVDREAETIALGWNTEYQMNENWTLELDASYSSVERVEANTEIYLGTGRGAGNGALDTLGYSLQPDGGAIFSHNLDYSDPSLITLGGPVSWGGGLVAAGVYDSADAQDGFINAPETDDELSAIRFSAEQVVNGGFLSTIEYGVRYAKREKTLRDKGYFLTLNAYPADVAVPSEYLLDPTSLDFIGMGDVIAVDARALYEDGYYTETDEALSTVSRTTNSWTVTEKVFNAYVQANIDTEWVTGNVGVQAVHTNQYSDGWAAVLRDGRVDTSAVRDGAKYWDFLPSMNLSFNLNENNKFRVGVAQVLARGKMEDMNAGFTFGYNNTQNRWTATGGNPQIKPFKTWQFDVSYETYFGEGGYLAVAGFYKEIQSYPFKTSTDFDFSPILGDLAGAITLPDGTAVPDVGVREQIENIDNAGHIYGLELSGSLPLSTLSESLEGFGLLGSASFTESSIKETPDSDPITMPGLSKTVLNGTVYYENKGFNARASVRHRSKFLGEVSALSLTRTLVDVDSETIVDAQLSYDLSEVGVDGLTVLFQVNNLTNQEFVTRFQTGYVRDYQNYGRTFLFGLNYKM